MNDVDVETLIMHCPLNTVLAYVADRQAVREFVEAPTASPLPSPSCGFGRTDTAKTLRAPRGVVLDIEADPFPAVA